MQGNPYEQPRWQRDFERFLPLKSQFVLSGNVRDLQVAEVSPGVLTTRPLVNCISDSLRARGCEHVILFEPVVGFSVCTDADEPEANDTILARLGLQSSNGRAPSNLEALADVMTRVVTDSEVPTAIVVDYAARLVSRASDLTQAEHQLFTRALLLSHKARNRPVGSQRTPLFNSIVWVVEREGDLPDWLLVENPRVRHISIPKPDSQVRASISQALLRPLGAATSDEERARAVRSFVDGTDGMLLLDLNAVALLARVEGVPLAQIGEAVRRYKLGVTEDPWRRIDRDKIRGAKAFVAERVKGQDAAVTHMLDIVKRAMTGAGNARRGNRPRGVAFLAGPTGVGKTELAKTITSLLFGDEGSYIRFDMSEFSAEHADQRLVGAPPGYIGYDAGGELTNAIREKPFSVVLFDEIEKAHPKVLDKFLQILDDGVLTSGRGDRVYFSEAIIVFTSNLGIYKTAADGSREPNVSPTEPFEAVRTKVLAEISRYFKFDLNRPEILNRIGENVLVFDFIRADIAGQIFDQMVCGNLKDLNDQGFCVELSDEAKQHLRGLCLEDLSNGGRGIRNHVEAHLLNPLARELFDQDVRTGQRVVVSAIGEKGLTLNQA